MQAHDGRGQTAKQEIPVKYGLKAWTSGMR